MLSYYSMVGVVMTVMNIRSYPENMQSCIVINNEHIFPCMHALMTGLWTCCQEFPMKLSHAGKFHRLNKAFKIKSLGNP